MTMGSRCAGWLRVCLMILASTLPAIGSAAAETRTTFEQLAGRWVGEGRLGVKDARPESVKCRVTYVLTGDTRQAKQTIRCASASGHVEVQSTLKEAAGVLSGTWQELTRDWGGDLAGSVTQHGLKVAIKGVDLNADMEIILRGGRQIIEIQFFGGSLIGLTLVLAKG